MGTTNIRSYQFQQDAIDAALDAFNNGRMRYLVADEAGLGKTHVARGIIEAYRKNNSVSPTVVFYFGSNLHLLKNTVDKLKGDSDDLVEMRTFIYENRTYVIDRLSVAGAAATKADTSLEAGKAYIFAFSANLLDAKISVDGTEKERHLLEKVGKTDGCEGSELSERRTHFNKRAFELLQPAVVILDEFHRYTDVLPLVAELTKTNNTPLLLLSATPYIVQKDDWKKGDYLEKTEDLIENEGNVGEDTAFSFPKLLRFLIGGDTSSDCGDDLLSEYIALWKAKNTPAIADYLKQYIWRNERVSSGEKYLDLPPKEDFLKGKYDDCMEYAYDCGRQSQRYFSLCPGAWSFAFKRWGNHEGSKVANVYQDFKKYFETDFEESLENASPARENFLFSFLSQENEQAPDAFLANIKKCLRTRLIYEYEVEYGRNLLWVPPSSPLYPFIGAFEGQERFSKLLVFSGYAMVPRMVATVFSYAADMDGGQANNVQGVRSAVEELRRLDETVSEDPTLLDTLSNCWTPAQTSESFESLRKTISAKIAETHCRLDITQKLKKSGRAVRLEANTLSKYVAASPLVCAYRILKDIEQSKKVAEAFRAYFASRAISLYLARQNCTSPDALLDYCVCGNLQAMLFEYAFTAGSCWGKKIRKALCFGEEKAGEKETDETKLLVFTDIQPIKSDVIPCRFSERLSPDHKDTGASETSDGGEARLKAVESAFQSPFWPMILATTSVGQEGIDLDAYCSRIMHYSIPPTPMAFEQRDGRVDRRRSLLARRKMALRAAELKLVPDERFWENIFSEEQEQGHSGLSPDWVQMNDHSDLRQERIIPFFPYSEEYVLYRRLVECKNIYRSQMGDPNEVSTTEKRPRLKLNNIEE